KCQCPRCAYHQQVVLAVWRTVAYYAFNGRISASRKGDLLFAKRGRSLLLGCRVPGSHGYMGRAFRCLAWSGCKAKVALEWDTIPPLFVAMIVKCYRRTVRLVL